MADTQRIHPVHDPEAQIPTAPLVTRATSRSDKGDPDHAQRQHNPPQQYGAAAVYTRPPKRKSCLRRCCCWVFSLLLIVILLLGVLAAIIYFGFDPEIPDYSVDGIRITQLTLNNDNSLTTNFNVNVTARNPNSKIGIYYEGNSHLSAYYSGQRLCEGQLPRFYQGHRNTTVINVNMNGQVQDAGSLVTALTADQQTGSIPLLLRARVPVRIRLGNLRLTRWTFRVRCNVIVDSLSTQNNIRIRSSSCRFRFRL